MKNKLEQLLNSLIEKGWKPRGESEPIYMLSSKKLYIPDTMEVNRSLRDLVSKESGLWQFVCENKLLPKKNGYVWNLIDHYDFDKTIKWIGEYNSFYYIIESALKDESELEDFLLSNIVIKDE